jgi:dTDP-glucose 4,6-dehydratase
MKILITGSRGVIGQRLFKELEKRGFDVFGLDIVHFHDEIGYSQQMSHGKWQYSRCDIGEFRQLERVISQAGPFDLVFNCAAEFGRWNGEDFYEQMWRSNVVGLKNLILLQEKFGFRLVHFSSSEIYGDYNGVMKEDVTEKLVMQQMNDYAISKWANELQIKNSIIFNNSKTVIVRLFNVYGPGEFYHPYRSAYCKFCYHAIKEIPITVYRGHQRSCLYIDDAVRTIANIADNFIAGRIYNISGNESHNMETVAQIAWDYTGAPKELIIYKDNEKATTKLKIPDATLAKQELKHKQTILLNEGLRKTIDWMKDYYA